MLQNSYSFPARLPCRRLIHTTCTSVLAWNSSRCPDFGSCEFKVTNAKQSRALCRKTSTRCPLVVRVNLKASCHTVAIANGLNKYSIWKCMKIMILYWFTHKNNNTHICIYIYINETDDLGSASRQILWPWVVSASQSRFNYFVIYFDHRIQGPSVVCLTLNALLKWQSVLRAGFNIILLNLVVRPVAPFTNMV